jgi:flagellar hook-associated protein FlgK
MVRASSNGVNVDEEMIMLIAQQQAFAAASRLVTVADEMVTEILRMV